MRKPTIKSGTAKRSNAKPSDRKESRSRKPRAQHRLHREGALRQNARDEDQRQTTTGDKVESHGPLREHPPAGAWTGLVRRDEQLHQGTPHGRARTTRLQGHGGTSRGPRWETSAG